MIVFANQSTNNIYVDKNVYYNATYSTDFQAMNIYGN